MSPRGPIAFPSPEASPQGIVRKYVHFRPAGVTPPSRIDLLLVVQYDPGRLPVTISGEYVPMLRRSIPWLHTGGNPVRGRVLAWATAPVVTDVEFGGQTP